MKQEHELNVETFLRLPSFTNLSTFDLCFFTGHAVKIENFFFEQIFLWNCIATFLGL